MINPTINAPKAANRYPNRRDPNPPFPDAFVVVDDDDDDV